MGWPTCSREDFLRVFTIYGHGGHLGHMTQFIYIHIGSPCLHIKFGFDWPSGFREDLYFQYYDKIHEYCPGVGADHIQKDYKLLP